MPKDGTGRVGKKKRGHQDERGKPVIWPPDRRRGSLRLGNLKWAGEIVRAGGGKGNRHKKAPAEAGA